MTAMHIPDYQEAAGDHLRDPDVAYLPDCSEYRSYQRAMCSLRTREYETHKIRSSHAYSDWEDRRFLHLQVCRHKAYGKSEPARLSRDGYHFPVSMP